MTDEYERAINELAPRFAALGFSKPLFGPYTTRFVARECEVEISVERHDPSVFSMDLLTLGMRFTWWMLENALSADQAPTLGREFGQNHEQFRALARADRAAQMYPYALKQIGLFLQFLEAHLAEIVPISPTIIKKYNDKNQIH